MKNASLAVAISIVLVLVPFSNIFVWGGSVCRNETGETAGDLLTGAYSYEKDGWKFIHVEGNPYQMGYQEGYLMADGITGILSMVTDLFWGIGIVLLDLVRILALQYWEKVPVEYKDEIKGIADGANAGGARLGILNREIDWKDVLLINAILDIGYEFMGLMQFLPELGCSAFICTGDATKNGEVILGHSTWTDYTLLDYMYTVKHLEPENGYEVLMQSPPGFIWSMVDWYVNGAGLMVAETTLDAGPYELSGTPIFVRARRAIQYAGSIDEYVEIMTTDNNGAYPCDWLVGDAKTGEAAILELGTYHHTVKRTFNGFLGSCNSAWDEEVRAEQTDLPFEEDPSYGRWLRWEELREQYYGNITPDLGKEFMGDHYCPVDRTMDMKHSYGGCLCGHGELDGGVGYKTHGAIDAKIVSSSMALNMTTWAHKGFPCGQEFRVDEYKKEHDLGVMALVMPPEDMLNDRWTVLGPTESRGPEPSRDYGPDELVGTSSVKVNGMEFSGMGCDMRAFDEDDNLIWSFATDGIIKAAPAVSDGRVFFGSDDWYMYAVDSEDGGLLWRYETGYMVRSSPTVSDGRVFFGSDDSCVYALDAETGELIWSYDADYWVRSSPAISDGKVFFGSYDFNVYALDAETGELIWNCPTEYYIQASPTVENGTVFIASDDGNLYTLNVEGGSPLYLD